MKPMSQWFRRMQASEDVPSDVPIAPEVTQPALPAELGDRVRDPITGFTGIVVVSASFLNGCVRCGVQPETMKDGLPKPEQHFDQTQLEVIEKAAFAPMMIKPAPAPGGPPRDTPSQQALSAPARLNPSI